MAKVSCPERREVSGRCSVTPKSQRVEFLPLLHFTQTSVSSTFKLWSARNTNVLYQKTWFEVKLKQPLVQSLQSEALQSNIQHTEV